MGAPEEESLRTYCTQAARVARGEPACPGTASGAAAGSSLGNQSSEPRASVGLGAATEETVPSKDTLPATTALKEPSHEPGSRSPRPSSGEPESAVPLCLSLKARDSPQLQFQLDPSLGPQSNLWNNHWSQENKMLWTSHRRILARSQYRGTRRPKKN